MNCLSLPYSELSIINWRVNKDTEWESGALAIAICEKTEQNKLNAIEMHSNNSIFYIRDTQLEGKVYVLELELSQIDVK